MSGDYKRLYRSRDERMISGVCGGIANYFSIDPTLVRLLFVALVLPGGPAVVAYILMAIIVPEEPTAFVAPAPSSPQPEATVEAEETEAGEPE